MNLIKCQTLGRYTTYGIPGHTGTSSAPAIYRVRWCGAKREAPLPLRIPSQQETTQSPARGFAFPEIQFSDPFKGNRRTVFPLGGGGVVGLPIRCLPLARPKCLLRSLELCIFITKILSGRKISWKI